MIIGKRKHFDIRCMFGMHKVTNVKMHVDKGMGYFGGPIVTFDWFCPRCGRRGIT